MTWEFITFWTRETVSNIRRNRLMSLLAVSTVTIGLFVLGTFFIAWASLQGTVKNQTKKLDLAVILNREITPKRRLEIYNAVRVPQVEDLQIVLKGQVLEEMRTEMKDLPVEDLKKDNPFGDELRIKLKNPQDIFAVSAYIETIKGVAKVRVDTQVARSLLAVSRFVSVIGIASLVVLGMGILLIIHNAIRLTVFARRREIRIMELVGATSWFIRIPFLLEGIVYGVTGAVYAAIGVAAMLMLVTNAGLEPVKMLMPDSPTRLLWQCIAGMLVAGIGFGLAGSWFSLSRSLGKATHF